MTWKPLLELRREGLPEVLVHGAVAWADADGPLHTFGGDPVVFGRSLMKPFQVAPFADELVDTLGEDGIALACASHNAQPEHLAVLATMRDAALTRAMQQPASLPLVPPKRKPKPSPLLHPCSGKHAALLQACRRRGWETANYTSASHPLHAAYVEGLKHRLGARWRPGTIARDGCGLPTIALRLTRLAQLFASLSRENRRSVVWRAMTSHPFLVGGTGRLDTDVIACGRSKAVAKEGADGLLAMGVLHRAYPNGLGVVVKIAHGWAPAQTRVVASRVLESVGVKLEAPPAPDGQTVFLPEGLMPP